MRECGVNARLDMFYLKLGQDLPQRMTNELIMADKVLLICDKYYAEKADNRNGEWTLTVHDVLSFAACLVAPASSSRQRGSGRTVPGYGHRYGRGPGQAGS